MKKFFNLLIMTALLLGPFFTSPAAAAGHSGRGGNTPAPTALPINSGIILLLVLGVFIGITAIRKYKISTVKA